jgi:predicted nucleic acid-binding protein
MAYLLDTTVLIDALRGLSAADRLLRMRAAEEVPYICAINAEEIARGMRGEEEARTVAFLGAFRVIRLTVEHGITAGAWRRDFAARGITLSQADCLIAAAASSVGAVLATGNPDGFPMPEVAVDHWPVGE